MIGSFRLHLAAEGKAAKTVRTYTEAVQWFAARLLRETGRTRWQEVRRRDVQEWTVWLLKRYSAAYASNQFRAPQQFFKWLASEDEIPDPMAGLRPPRVPDRPVPVFADDELRQLERACAGRSFQQRRDAAMIAVFRATGMRRQNWRASATTRPIRWCSRTGSGITSATPGWTGAGRRVT